MICTPHGNCGSTFANVNVEIDSSKVNRKMNVSHKSRIRKCKANLFIGLVNFSPSSIQQSIFSGKLCLTILRWLRFVK